MPLPVTPFMWAGAALPLLLLLYLLVRRQWPAVNASAAAALAAFVVAFMQYRAPLGLLLGEAGKGLWNSASIIAVTVTAILMYEVSREAGGFAAIQRDLTRLIPDRLLQVLALGWCFTSFLQGPSGFGVPIAVTAPLLIGIGVAPLWAVLVPLMAHAWANTFGTLALAWEALAQQTSLGADPAAYQQAALWTGTLTGLLCLLAGGLICWQYRGLAGLKRGLPAVLILGGIQAGGQLLLCRITPILCAVLPTTVALGAAFALGRLPRYARRYDETSPMFKEEGAPRAENARLSLHEALLPYYALVGISVFVLLTPPVASFLGTWKMSLSFAASATGHGFNNPAAPAYGPVAWLTHSAAFLLAASLLSGGYFARKGLIGREGARRIMANTLRKSLPASLSVALLLVMSKVMSGSGQVDVLAGGTAAAAGGLYALLAPLVGTLGAFMSSSNVSSNILFGAFQESVARMIHKDPALILAAQTSGGAIGTMFSPSKVLLGTTTAGIVGQEGAIIRRLLGIALAAALLMGLIVLAFA